MIALKLYKISSKKNLEFFTSTSLFKYFRLIITLRGHMRKFLATLGCMLSLMASYGHAESHGNNCENSDLVVFGNSLSDTGNAFTLSTQVSPGCGPTPPSPPYFNGRFSNGPNWVDYTAENLDIDVQNFAVGGALSNNTNIYQPPFGVYPMGGLVQQIGRFQAADGHINKDQITILEIGNNDFLRILLTPPPTAAKFTLTTLQVLGDISGTLPVLQDLGAERTVVWNLPPIGSAPLFTNPFLNAMTAPLGPVYNQVVDSYNTNLLSTVRNQNLVSKGHKTVYYFDVNSVFNDIRNQFIAEGVNPSDTQIASNLGICSPTFSNLPHGPETIFFDQVHPSTEAWRRFAKEFSAYLDTIDNSHRTIGAQHDAIAVDYRAFRTLLDNHFRTLHRQFYVCPTDCDECCDVPSCYQVYVDGLAKWGKTRNGCGIRGFHYDTQLVGLGLDYFLNNCLTTGVSFTAQRNNAKLYRGGDDILLNEYIPTLYASYTDHCFFADFDISYRYLYFKKLTRKVPFVCRNLHAHATGWGISTGLQGGWLYNCECLSTGPIVGFNYQSALIHAYNEKGRRYPSLHVKGQREENFFGKVGWQFFWNDCNCGFSPFGEVDYFYDFFHHRRKIMSRFRHVNDRSQIRHKVQNNRERNFLTYNLGVGFGVCDGVTGNISYQGESTFHNYNNSVIAELDAKF